MNPVYMIVDNAAYHYWLSRVDLYADNTDFDGCHGIAVFNRTLQKPGRAHSMRAMDDWIVTVGKHKGVISGQDWIKVQEILEQNRSSEFSKPRSEVALLTGFLCCAECESPMSSKLSKRKNAAGERIYSYICSSKDKGGNVKCTMKAANGIDLDDEIIETIKKLSGDTEFMKRLKQNININSDTRNRDLIYLLDLFHSNYDNLNMVHKRNILHSLIKEAIWDGEQMLISFLY